MTSISKKVILFLRILIALLAYGFLSYKIYQLGYDQLVSILSTVFQSSKIWLNLFVFLLMPVSWLLEAQKWRISLKKIEDINLLTALKSAWYGVVTGQLTPNRIGEPVGRIAMISPQNRTKALIYSIWCGLNQQLATLIFGIVGLLHWKFIGKQLNFIAFNSRDLIYILTIIAVALIIVISRISWFTTLINHFKIIDRLTAGEDITVNHSAKKTYYVIIISMIRYLVFSTQYLLLLFIFGVSADFSTIYSAIFITYLITSFIPSFALSEAGIRASVALTIIGTLSSNSISIVAASLALWVLNVGFPSIIGAWFPWFRK